MLWLSDDRKRLKRKNRRRRSQEEEEEESGEEEQELQLHPEREPTFNITFHKGQSQLKLRLALVTTRAVLSAGTSCVACVHNSNCVVTVVRVVQVQSKHCRRRRHFIHWTFQIVDSFLNADSGASSSSKPRVSVHSRLGSFVHVASGSRHHGDTDDVTESRDAATPPTRRVVRSDADVSCVALPLFDIKKF